MIRTGEKRRTLQHLASRGRIPGAAKLSRNWTFDLERLEQWIEACENAAVPHNSYDRAIARLSGRGDFTAKAALAEKNRAEKVRLATLNASKALDARQVAPGLLKQLADKPHNPRKRK